MDYTYKSLKEKLRLRWLREVSNTTALAAFSRARMFVAMAEADALPLDYFAEPDQAVFVQFKGGGRMVSVSIIPADNTINISRCAEHLNQPGVWGEVDHFTALTLDDAFRLTSEWFAGTFARVDKELTSD